MSTTITLRKTDLAALLHCSGDKDARYYLNGILVEIGNKETRLVATNGHLMGIVRVEDQCDPTLEDSIEIVIPREAIDHIKPGKTEIVDTIELEVTVFQDAGVTKAKGVLRDGGMSKMFDGLYGRFPDYRRVVPRTTSGRAGQFAPEYLARFMRIAKLYGTKHFVLSHDGPMASALVTIVGNHNFLGIIMPYKEDAPQQAPSWARDAVTKI